MKKTILLIAAVSFSTNVHAGRGDGLSQKQVCKMKIDELNSRIAAIQSALNTAEDKITQARTMHDLLENDSATALGYKKCIFKAYDSSPLLIKPSKYSSMPTGSTAATETEMKVLKSECEYALELATATKRRTEDDLQNVVLIKLAEAQAIYDDQSLSASASKFNECIGNAHESLALLRIMNPTTALVQVNQEVAARENHIREEAAAANAVREREERARASLEQAERERVASEQAESIRKKEAVEQDRREFEQQQPVLIPQWRALLLGASPSAADTTRFNALIQAIPLDRRQNVIDILTLVIKKSDNKTRKIKSENEDSVVILDLMDQLKSKSLPQTEEIKTCAKELIAGDMYKHIAYGVIRGITYLPDAKRSEVVEAVKNFDPIMKSSRKPIYIMYTIGNLHNMQDQWENIFRRAKEFITSKMEDSAARSILHLMKNNIPTVEKREAVVMAMKQVTHKSDGKLRSGATDRLISDVCTKAQNPEKWTELMGKISDRLTDTLKLPEAVALMNNPDEAGGV